MVRRLVPLLWIAVAVLAAVAVAPSATAGAHPPVPLCGGCTGGFEDAAAAHGANARVERSQLDLRVHENATVTGEATLRVNERAAERFRENSSLLDAVAADAFRSPESSERSRWADEAVVREAEDVDVSIADRRITVSFVVPDGAREGVGGVVYTELLRRNATVGGIELGVDRATVTGPDDAVLVRAPVDRGGDTVVFESAGDSDHVGYGGYLAWAPGGGPVGQGAASASLWVREASTEYPRVAVASALAVVLAAALGALLVLAGPRPDSRFAQPPSFLAVAYAMLAPVASIAAILLYVFRISDTLAVATLALAAGAVGVAVSVGVLELVTGNSPRALGRLPIEGFLALPVVLALALVAGVASPLTVALLTATGALPLVGVLGVASARGPLPAVATTVAFALTPVGVTFASDAATPLGEPAVVVWTLLVVLVGLPLFALGRRGALAYTERDGDADTDHATPQR